MNNHIFEYKIAVLIISIMLLFETIIVENLQSKIENLEKKNNEILELLKKENKHD